MRWPVSRMTMEGNALWSWSQTVLTYDSPNHHPNDNEIKRPGFAETINRTSQDIGARRLNTVVHRVLEDISFRAPRMRGQTITIDAKFVKERLQSFDPVKENTLTKYIL